MSDTETQRMIESADYTPQIRQVIAILERRMNSTLTEYSVADDLIVVQDGNVTYVLANPILGKEPLYDEFSEIEKWIPVHNLTMTWSDDWMTYDPNRGKFIIKNPRIKIIRPDLCMKILPDGTVIDGGIPAHDELVPTSAPHSDRLMFDALFEMAGMD